MKIVQKIALAADGRMPVGAYVSPPPAFIADEYFRAASEAGINVMYALYEKAPDDLPAVLKALDLCEKYGMKYLVIDRTLREMLSEGIADAERIAAAAAPYAAHPAFAGHLVQDEPGVVHFDNLARFYRAYKAVLPDKLFHVNLLPFHATAYQLQYARWSDDPYDVPTDYRRDYLDAFLAQVGTPYLSYDCYPIVTVRKIRDGYFGNLSDARQASAAVGVPLWVFIQSCRYNRVNCNLPDRNELLWQVNVSLAYGATGIQYFCFWTPYDSGGEVFDGAMFSSDGKKNVMYNYCAEANRQLKACETRLMNAAFIGLHVIGDSPSVVPVRDLTPLPPQVTEIEGGDFLTGIFDCASGGKLLYIVHNTTSPRQKTLRLQFARPIEAVVVRRGEETRFFGAQLHMDMEGGEGILVKL